MRVEYPGEGASPVGCPLLWFSLRTGLVHCRLGGYAGIRRVLPGCQSRRRPEPQPRGQPLQTEARNAKGAPESTIRGVLPEGQAPTGSVLRLVPISSPRREEKGSRRATPGAFVLPVG